VAAQIASTKGLALEEVAHATSANVDALFSRITAEALGRETTAAPITA